MKLSDFGFVKKTTSRGSFTQSGLKGTDKWMAPEILELIDDIITSALPHGTIKSDTFAAGCVFFYFLTRGKHPFDEPNTITERHDNIRSPHGNIKKNIKKNDPKALIDHKKSKYFIYSYLHHADVYKSCSTFF